MSFTCDIWTDQQLASFLALSAHHVRKDENGNLYNCNHLLAFRRVVSHAGKPVADLIFDLLKKADLLRKVCLSFCMLCFSSHLYSVDWDVHVRQRLTERQVHGGARSSADTRAPSHLTGMGTGLGLSCTRNIYLLPV